MRRGNEDLWLYTQQKMVFMFFMVLEGEEIIWNFVDDGVRERER
jgi:hypothetical protein